MMTFNISFESERKYCDDATNEWNKSLWKKCYEDALNEEAVLCIVGNDCSPYTTTQLEPSGQQQ